MYFAMDKGDVVQQSQVLEALLGSLPAGLHCYALLDDGFDYKRRKIWQARTSWPLYHQPDWGELQEVSPRLVELQAGG
ncbi:hypothetical protein [Pseudogulbenkiania ferrooxidans]|uniref:Uncharacterized protein n=1 Tax=Pseudogulbenkiania ferrooxidans 2002 TaxID=279714 RepID=B9Z266_9NEIS|nr:hypothetical protein [Pseudogulbenkiania ferrooxidans]EEG09511.1 conserved hypothetical protein [Pseudogulbenkiania ferrooxidans 2002]